MKKLLFIVAIFAMLSANSQTSVYHPFPDSNACWNIDMAQYMCFLGGFSSEQYSIVFSGDTSIGGQTYHKLNTPFVEFYDNGNCGQANFPGYKGAIRQDITERKVFFIPPMQAEEQLLYDFTLEVGDTIKGYLEGFNPQADTVVEIDSVLVGDNYCKRWLINPCYNVYLVEGIGSTYGLLVPSNGCITDMPNYDITCFSKNGQTLFPDNSSDCQLITSINNSKHISLDINVFPNPSSGSFTIDLSNQVNTKEIQITNMFGETILRKQVQEQVEVRIENMPIGTYILVIVNTENKISGRKVVTSL